MKSKTELKILKTALRQIEARSFGPIGKRWFLPALWLLTVALWLDTFLLVARSYWSEDTIVLVGGATGALTGALWAWACTMRASLKGWLEVRTYVDREKMEARIHELEDGKSNGTVAS